MVRLEISYRVLVTAAIVFAAALLMLKLAGLLVLVAFAVLLAVGLAPYVEALVAKGLPRTLSVLIILLVVLGAFAGLIALILPGMLDEFGNIKDDLPEAAADVERMLSHVSVNVELEERARNIDWDRLISGRQAVDYSQRVLSVTLSIVTVLAMTAYMLADAPRLIRFVSRFIPERRKKDSEELAQSLTRVVGGYLRGQFITSLSIAVYTFLVLAGLGVPNPLAFAALAGFADIVPLVGALIAVVPPVFVALTESPSRAIAVLALLMIYQQFEDRFLVPRVYGQTLNLPPIVVLFAVLIGAEVRGITGILLALPIVAAGRVLLDYVMAKRMISMPAAQPGEQVLAPDVEPSAGGAPKPVKEPPRRRAPRPTTASHEGKRPAGRRSRAT